MKLGGRARTTTRIKPDPKPFSTPLNTRPHCLQCLREKPQWEFCPNPPDHCPVRAAYAPNRPDTTIISVSEPGYEIVVFFRQDGSAQAIISRPGGKEPIDIPISAPIPGRCIVIERKGGTFNVVYRAAP